jgi:hypothetical protein
MGDPLPEVKMDLVSTDGLEDVFDLEPVTDLDSAPVTGTPGQVTSASEPVTHATKVVPTSAEAVPVEQAARVLGTSINALKKRLRKGTLRGCKVDTKHGEKWFVEKLELVKMEPVTGSSREPVTGTPEQVTSASEPVTHASKEVPGTAEGVPEQTDLVSPVFERLVMSLEKKDAVIESQAHQLKAAGDVIMYLRAQIEEKEIQVKLLTDSQHKRGWWARFGSWFMGVR